MKTVLSFIAGFAVGAFAMWKYVKKCQERLENEEIEPEKTDAQNETYDPAVTEEVSETPDETEEEKASRTAYDKVIKDSYTRKGPTMISADDFGDGTCEIRTTLLYYNDGHITDNEGMLLDDTDIDESLGKEWVDNFGDEDTIYIRNERLHCDYEIQRIYENYFEDVEDE